MLASNSPGCCLGRISKFPRALFVAPINDAKEALGPADAKAAVTVYIEVLSSCCTAFVSKYSLETVKVFELIAETFINSSSAKIISCTAKALPSSTIIHSILSFG